MVFYGPPLIKAVSKRSDLVNRLNFSIKALFFDLVKRETNENKKFSRELRLVHGARQEFKRKLKIDPKMTPILGRKAFLDALWESTEKKVLAQ